MKYALGIDIGGTNTKLGIVNEDGKVLKRSEFKTTDYDNFTSYSEGLIREIKLLINSAEGECLGIGIGAPNGNFYKGVIEFAPNLPFGECAPIVETLKSEFKYERIFLTNDANAAALGEKIYGGGKNLDHFILITLGTGLGSGIIIDGKLLYGADGFAGELGHVCAVENGRVCGCGKRGCLETYASATGIRRTFFDLVSKYCGKTSLKNKSWDEIDPKVIEFAAKDGDKVALETYQITGEILGRCLADFVHFSRPAAIFLFGGPVKSGDLILKPTISAMERNLMKPFKNKIQVVPSHLPEADAAILGASALVWSGSANA